MLILWILFLSFRSDQKCQFCQSRRCVYPDHHYHGQFAVYISKPAIRYKYLQQILQWYQQGRYLKKCARIAWQKLWNRVTHESPDIRSRRKPLPGRALHHPVVAGRTQREALSQRGRSSEAKNWFVIYSWTLGFQVCFQMDGPALKLNQK